MITKNDVLLLLSELKDNGIDTSEQVKALLKEGNPTIEILTFINDHRELDLTKFYEKLRRSHNDGKSKLYKNLMSDFAEENPMEALTALNSYTLQILLFSKEIENKQLFFKFTRLEEAYRCLHYYSKTYDLMPCLKLLHMIRSDIKVLEHCYRNK